MLQKRARSWYDKKLCLVNKRDEIGPERAYFYLFRFQSLHKGGSKTAATSKIEHFVIIVNGLTIMTKCSILDVAVVLDLPLL